MCLAYIVELILAQIEDSCSGEHWANLARKSNQPPKDRTSSCSIERRQAPFFIHGNHCACMPALTRNLRPFIALRAVFESGAKWCLFIIILDPDLECHLLTFNLLLVVFCHILSTTGE